MTETVSSDGLSNLHVKNIYRCDQMMLQRVRDVSSGQLPNSAAFSHLCDVTI